MVEVGDEDGIPPFWFHGSPVGNLGVLSVEPAAAGLALRVICAARPGTRAATRRSRDWRRSCDEPASWRRCSA